MTTKLHRKIFLAFVQIPHSMETDGLLQKAGVAMAFFSIRLMGLREYLLGALHLYLYCFKSTPIL